MTSRQVFVLRVLGPLGLMLTVACTDKPAPSVQETWENVCVDTDGDRFGFQCSKGDDCDDTDPAVQTDCSDCRSAAQGCACEEGAAPLDCKLPPSLDTRGALICHTGTRYCRDQAWSDCEGIASFAVPPPSRRLTSSALVDPEAPPVLCDPCNPDCYRVEDPLVTPPGTDLGPGIIPAAGGGVTLAGEFGPGDMGPFTGLLDDAPCASDDLGDCDGLPPPFDTTPNQDPAGTAHRTLFLDLPPGSSMSRSFATRVAVSTADIYFYLDTTSTMVDELSALRTSFGAGNHLPSAGAGLDCVDTNFDGTPDNQHKSQGIAGNIACFVRDARFGAGWFREIPFYGPLTATGQAVAPWDTEMFEHRHDISADMSSVASVIATFGTRANLNVPEASMQGLWSIATGGEIYAGWDRPGVPARQGCPAGSWGYPCFRDQALPIVVHFTDAPMQAGPATAPRASTTPATPASCLADARVGSGGSVECEPLHYDAAVLSALRAGTQQSYRQLTSAAEDIARAEPVGVIDNLLVSYVGSSASMTSDHSYANLGGFSCPSQNAWSPADQGSPDAVFRFRVNSAGTYLASARGTRFDATLMLLQVNPAGVPTRAVACSDEQVSLGQAEELHYTPEIETALTPGEYVLVLKGYRATSRGMFQISLGRRSLQVAGSFAARRWLGPQGDGLNGVRQALIDRAIRVITVQSGTDPYAQEQARALAAATGAVAGGQPVMGSIPTNGQNLGPEVVRVLREFLGSTRMSIGVELVQAPDDPTPDFELRVEALAQVGNGCTGVADTDADPRALPDTHVGCSPGATPQFSVTFRNPLGTGAVPRNAADPSGQGGYRMWLRVIGDGQYLVDQIPVYIVPEDAIPDPVPSLVRPSASYEQEVHSNGCAADEGPVWRALVWDASLPAGTRVSFELCAADDPTELAACTFREAVSIEPGVACADVNDCGGTGYCDPSNVCHQVSGPDCALDVDCGLGGTCSTLAARRACTYVRSGVDLRPTASFGMQGRRLARVRARLFANADHTQAPTLHRWTLDYTCAPRE